MTKADSRRPLTAEDRVRFQVSPHEICGGKRSKGTDFSPSTSVFCNTIIPPVFPIHLPIHIAKQQAGKAWEPSKKSSAVSEIG
jgi:hypothetical protein